MKALTAKAINYAKQHRKAFYRLGRIALVVFVLLALIQIYFPMGVRGFARGFEIWFNDQWDFVEQNHMKPDWQQAWAAWAGVVVAVVAVIFVSATLNATRQMVKDTKEIGDRQTDAYIDRESQRFDGNSNQLRITLKNYGPTVATNVSYRTIVKAVDIREFENDIDTTVTQPVIPSIPPTASVSIDIAVDPIIYDHNDSRVYSVVMLEYFYFTNGKQKGPFEIITLLSRPSQNSGADIRMAHWQEENGARFLSIH